MLWVVLWDGMLWDGMGWDGMGWDAMPVMYVMIVMPIMDGSSQVISQVTSHTLTPSRTSAERELLYDKILDVSFTGHSGTVHFKPKIGDRFPVKMEIVNIYVSSLPSLHH